MLKPSPFTPLCTLRIGELMREIFPPGVVNIIAGGDELGALISAHPDIDKISFTGSVVTGKKVMASAASTLKRVTLELGGNDAAIVLEDVDVADSCEEDLLRRDGQQRPGLHGRQAHLCAREGLRRAVPGAGRGGPQGQVGNGLEPATVLGPIQNHSQYERVRSLLQDDTRQRRPDPRRRRAAEGKGYFVAPTVVAGPDEHSRLVVEEQLGPLIPVMKFSDVNDALRRANDTRFGLSGSVWSRMWRARRRSRRSWKSARRGSTSTARRGPTCRSEARRNRVSAALLDLGLRATWSRESSAC